MKNEPTAYHFTISNPQGPSYGNIPALLRRAADHIEELGDVKIADIAFTSVVTVSEDAIYVTVYYHRTPSS